MKKKKGTIWVVLTAVTAVLLAICIAAIPVTQGFATVINSALKAKTQKVVAQDGAEIYYWSAWENEEDLVAHEAELCRQIEGEGAALLINRDNTLPLPQGTKFTTFSQSSFNLLYGGTGSGSMKADDAISLRGALIEAFGDDCLNVDQWKFLASAGYKRVNADTTGGNQAQYRINEIPWEKYPAALQNTWASYGDVALVVLARSGGEGADVPNALPELTEYMTNGDYLRLCKEEIEMFENLEKLKANGTFKKIVVLLNSSNALQLDFVDSYGIDAVLWIGDVGMTGARGVADILSGKVNPSGRIVDTFMKDNHSAPAIENFGAFRWTNGAEYETDGAQSNTEQAGVAKANREYVVYQEGIYVGYRYFETRYEDSVLGQGNSGDWSYSDCVAFPFGYGLSYTDFAYSNFKVADEGETFKIDVDVKNVGSVDGKHTVQIYFQSPYTEYDRQNLVEKAAVELCGFDKKMIAAGDTEHFTITVEKEDLTSYDANNAKTYILEDGDYYFTVGKNAHDAINNILAHKGADASKMTGAGDAALAYKWTNAAFDKTTYAVSSKTGKPITNLFDDADLNKYAGNGGQTVTYLSRQDWIGTYPTLQILSITPEMWADGLTHDEEGHQAIVEKMKAAYYADAKMPTIGAPGTLKVGDLFDASYDDARWEQLIAQMPYDEMTNLIYNGFHITQAAPSIGLPGTLDENGPQGFTASLMGGASAMAYTSEDVMAATYNRELIRDMGECIGEDFLHATPEGADKVYAGLYGPGANIHRTPYSGRNFEYYSEDGWLAGEVAAIEVKAIRDKGVVVYCKHFALNDQEEGRYGIATWSNEQAIRELYLEGFEGAVKEAGGSVMSSFNRIGVVWSGANRNLMTGILRDEWGLEGGAITDCSVYAKYMDYRYGVLAGQDLWDGYSRGMATLDGLDGDPAIVAAVQERAKNIAYNYTHSHAMNVGSAEIIPITPWWQLALYGAAAGFGLLTAAFLVLAILAKKKAKQN